MLIVALFVLLFVGTSSIFSFLTSDKSRMCPSSVNAISLGFEYESPLDVLGWLWSSDNVDEDELLDEEEGSSPPLRG
jgi:hypothetical protein